MDLKEQAAEARMMGDVYSLLFECFSHPTDEFVEKLASDAVHAAFAAILDGDTSHADTQRGLELVDGTRFRDFQTGDLRLLIEADYNRLFVGPGKLLAPPYESVYLSKRDFFQKEGKEAKAIIDPMHAASLNREYVRQGYAISDTYSDFADHIMFELDYCSYLYRKAAEAFEANEGDRGDACLALERVFVADHLAQWIGALTERINGNTKAGFHEGAALLARRILRLEQGAM